LISDPLDAPIERLTPVQATFYRDQGYLQLGAIFTRQEMYELRIHVDAMIANLQSGQRPEGLDVPHFTDPWLFRYLAHPRVLDIMEGVIGPDIVLWSSHFIAKPKGDGRAVPWHTDGAYWGERLQPMEVATLWLAVDESTVENGCMRVIAGSHREAQAMMDAYEPVDRDTNVFDARLRAELVNEARAVNLELKPGECSLHDAWTIHGSTANTSDKRRCGYTMRYMPSYVVHSGRGGGLPDSHHIYLLRGEDRSGGKNIYTPIPNG
jgi:chlorinating enzyme